MKIDIDMPSEMSPCDKDPRPKILKSPHANAASAMNFPPYPWSIPSTFAYNGCHSVPPIPA